MMQLSPQAEEALLIREKTAEICLQLWLERLENSSAQSGRNAVLESTLDAALLVGCAPMGNIQLFNPRQRGLEIQAQRGFKDPFLNYFEFVGDTSTPCGIALRESQLVMVPDVTESPIFFGSEALEVLLDAGVRAVHSTPLVGASGRVLGVLSIHYRRPRSCLNGDLDRMSTLARTTARLLEDRSPGRFV